MLVVVKRYTRDKINLNKIYLFVFAMSLLVTISNKLVINMHILTVLFFARIAPAFTKK